MVGPARRRFPAGPSSPALTSLSSLFHGLIARSGRRRKIIWFSFLSLPFLIGWWWLDQREETAPPAAQRPKGKGRGKSGRRRPRSCYITSTQGLSVSHSLEKRERLEESVPVLSFLSFPRTDSCAAFILYLFFLLLLLLLIVQKFLSPPSISLLSLSSFRPFDAISASGTASLLSQPPTQQGGEERRESKVGEYTAAAA